MSSPKFFFNIIGIILFLIVATGKSHAQQWLGISGSNYGGTNSVYNNPANLSDSRYKVYVNLVANDVFLANNYVGYNAPYSIIKLLTNSADAEFRNSKNIIIFKNAYYDINETSDSYHLNFLNDLRGPAVLLSLKNNKAIGFLTRVRSGVNFSGVPLSLANSIRLGTDTLLNQNQKLNISDVSMNINSYAELGFSYSQILKDDDEDFFKIGITVKRVVGIYNAHAIIQDAEYDIIDDPNVTSTTRKDAKQILRIKKLKADYGYTDESAYKATKPSLDWLLGNQSAGSGWGLDLGIVYEYRPDNRKYAYYDKGKRKLDPSKNKYEFKIGVSILDIGGINYKNPAYAKNWQVDVNNKEFNAESVSMIEGANDAFKRINQTLGLDDVNSQSNFTSGLPTALQINLDYHLKDKFYVNSLWVQGLRGNQSIGMKMPSSISVTPRWESKWVEVAMPFALLDNYNSFTFGLAGRLGPVFFGTDNLGSFLNINRPRGTDLYFGLSIPIFNRPPMLPNACFYDRKEGKGWKFWKKN